MKMKIPPLTMININTSVSFGTQLCALLFACLLGVSSAYAQEQQAEQQAYDCTVVSLDEIDPSTLSEEEYIALLEQALQDSIDRFEHCIDQVNTQNSQSGGGAGGGSGGTGGGEANTNGEGDSETKAEQGEANEGQDNNSSTENQQERAQGSGAQDQEVSAKDNDAAVCQLLEEELKIEKDPEKQRELKAIYKDYRC